MDSTKNNQNLSRSLAQQAAAALSGNAITGSLAALAQTLAAGTNATGGSSLGLPLVPSIAAVAAAALAGPSGSRAGQSSRATNPPGQQPQQDGEEDAGEGAEEEVEDVANTYSIYSADKVRALHPNCLPHPDPLVETASLASVQLPEPDTDHTLHEDVDEGRISDAQLEACIYAWRKFVGPRLPDGKRRGFFLGDGAGVGKGRTIASLIKQHWNMGGRYCLWVSVSQDLRRDARRDLDDIDADIQIYEPKSGAPVPANNADFKGVVFVTYSLLRSGVPKMKKRGRGAAPRSRVAALQAEAANEEGASGSAASSSGEGSDAEEAGDDSYYMNNLPANSRLAQIIRWLKRGGTDGALIVFDESHRAKNLIAEKGGQTTQTARAVFHLQEALGDAKVLYSSATGASEPRNLAYMTRMWGTEQTQKMVELLTEKRGGNLGALELAAMSLKATGSYLARTLSYDGAEFGLAKVAISSTSKIMYDRACLFWNLLYRVMCHVAHKKGWRAQFWGAHQRFFRSMLMASKVPACAMMAREAVQQGMAVVIGLQSTGEAATDHLQKVKEEAGPDAYVDADGNDDDLVSAPQLILETYIRNHFPQSHPFASAMESDGTLPNLEFQVWDAAKMWKEMPTVQELAANASAAAAAQRLSAEAAARLAGTDISADRRATDGQRAQLQAAILAEESRAQNAEVEARRKGAHKLVIAAQEARDDAADALKREKHDQDRILRALATVEAPAADGAAKKSSREVIVIEDSSDDEGGAPLVVLPAAKRQQVLGDSDDDSDAMDLIGNSDNEKKPAPTLARAPAPAHAPKKASVKVKAEPAVQPQFCMLCERPADIAMAVCDTCRCGVHVVCIGEWDIPKSWTCDSCLLKAPAAAKPAAPAAAVVMVKAESLVQVGDEAGPSTAPVRPSSTGDGSGDLESDAQLVKRSKGQLQLYLTRWQKRVAAAQQELASAETALAIVAQEEAAVGSRSGSSSRNQRRSKAGRKAAAASAAATAKLLADDTVLEAVRSPLKQPMMREVTISETAAASLADYRPAVNPRANLEAEVPDDYFPDEDEDMAPPAGVNHDLSPRLQRMRGWMLAIAQGGVQLPPNPLDHLVELLGGRRNVAELTGRKGGVERDGDGGKATYRQRNVDGPQKDINLIEKDYFMDGRKRIAIISDAASTGISLQADKRVRNQSRRLHITIELPWSADKAIQQFGRSHRANQASAPVYKIMVTPCGGEARFASAAAKRLQSLGALLRGDRNAVGAGSELKSFDIDTEEGSEALTNVLKCMTKEAFILPGVIVPTLDPNMNTEAAAAVQASEDVRALGGDSRGSDAPFFIYFRRRLKELSLLEGIEGEYKVPPGSKAKVATFLNRMLGLPIDEQDLLFKFFSDTYAATVSKRRSEGKLDTGIVEISGRAIAIVERSEVYRERESGAAVDWVKVDVDHGLSYEEALEALEESRERTAAIAQGRTVLSGFFKHRGYHMVSLSGARHPYVLLATEIVDDAAAQGRTSHIRLRIQRPYGHEKCEVWDLGMLAEKHYDRVQNDDGAKDLWNAWFNYTATRCMDGDNCRTLNCTKGQRRSTKHMLCGAVLGLWPRLVDLHKVSGHAKTIKRSGEGETQGVEPLQVRRAVTKTPGDQSENGQPVVGIMATNVEEMQFFVKNLTPSADPAADPLLRAHGTAYYTGPQVQGLQAGASRFNAGGRGKKPKHFR